MKPLEEMGKFATVVVDPPWDIPKGPVLSSRATDGGLFAPKLVYPTMTVSEIGALPINSVLDDDSFVFCWTTSRLLQDAFEIMEDWQVSYSFLMTWVKGGGPQFPGGACYNSEFIVVGKKGSPQYLDTRAFNAANYWQRTGHSQKPEGFYDLLRRKGNTGAEAGCVWAAAALRASSLGAMRHRRAKHLPDHYQQVLIG